MSSAKNVIETVRDVVQDLLVPEMKAIKVSVESIHSEMGYLRVEVKSSVDSLRTEVKGSVDSLRTEMKLRDEKMEQLIRHGDEKNEQALRTLIQRLDDTTELRERLASIEARLPRQ